MTRTPLASGCTAALLFLLTVTMGGCAIGHYYGSISGLVVDKETREPLEGAAVVAVYTVTLGSLGGSTTSEVEWQEVVSDAKGTFALPGHLVFSPRFGLGGYVLLSTHMDPFRWRRGGAAGFAT